MSTVTVTTPRDVLGLPPGTLPHPVRFASYAGDVSRMAAEAQLVGPNTMGEVLVAVEATYDQDADRTRVGFAYVPQQDAAGGASA